MGLAQARRGLDLAEGRDHEGSDRAWLRQDGSRRHPEEKRWKERELAASTDIPVSLNEQKDQLEYYTCMLAKIVRK